MHILLGPDRPNDQKVEVLYNPSGHPLFKRRRSKPMDNFNLLSFIGLASSIFDLLSSISLAYV
jgi:hypothetical protein